MNRLSNEEKWKLWEEFVKKHGDLQYAQHELDRPKKIIGLLYEDRPLRFYTPWKLFLSGLFYPVIVGPVVVVLITAVGEWKFRTTQGEVLVMIVGGGVLGSWVLVMDMLRENRKMNLPPWQSFGTEEI